MRKQKDFSIVATIGVVGLGYVGLTSALGLTILGHRVIGVDLDPKRVELLKKGVLPIYEPGLDDILQESLRKEEISFSTNFDDLSEKTAQVLVCVPTPGSPSGVADLTFLDSAIDSLMGALLPDSLVVIRSTVPIGTSQKLSLKLQANKLRLASNPEFFSEGTALNDFLNPSRIVVGTDSERTATEVDDLYKGIIAPRVMCGFTSAETIKHASNSFLAVKLSFVNELAALCEQTGANIFEVTQGMGLDRRIGQGFLNPGPGWGGSCFPKDSKELAANARINNVVLQTLEAAVESNESHQLRIVNEIESLVGGSVAGKTIALWGLAFKAGTDDVRESPAVNIGLILGQKGAVVQAFDPKVSFVPTELISVKRDEIAACDGADALIVLTEWEEFRHVDIDAVLGVMKANPVVFDTRRLLDQKTWKSRVSRFKALGQ